MASKDYLDSLYAVSRKESLRLMAEEEKRLVQVYSDAGKDLLAKFKKAPSGGLTSRMYKEYTTRMYVELNDLVQKYALDAATIPVDMQKFILEETGGLAGYNRKFADMFTTVPKDSVNYIVKGDLYKDGKGLSERIWNYGKINERDIQDIVLSGKARGQSAFEMAKALEQHVNPEARRYLSPAEQKKLFGRSYGKVEYNALRLARTTNNHASTMALRMAAKANPFVTGIQWHTSTSHSDRMHGRLDDCDYWNEKVFTITDCPFDHPNGLCYQTPYMTKTIKEMAEELRDWVDGKPNKKLDSWYKNYGSKARNIDQPKLKSKVNPVVAGVVKKELYAVPKGLKMPERPKKILFDSTEEYMTAREAYKVERKAYLDVMEDLVVKNLDRNHLVANQGESRAWLKANFNHINEGIDKDLDYRVLDDLIPVHNEMLETYPFLKDMHGVGAADGDALMEATGGINFNPKYFSDYRNALEAHHLHLEDNFTVFGDGSIRTIMRHEYGHNVETHIKLSDKFFKKKAYYENGNLDIGESLINHDIMRAYDQEIRELWKLDGVSEYAKTTTPELFAEGFAAYSGGETTEFATGFGKFIDRWLADTVDIADTNSLKLKVEALKEEEYLGRGHIDRLTGFSNDAQAIRSDLINSGIGDIGEERSREYADAVSAFTGGRFRYIREAQVTGEGSRDFIKMGNDIEAYIEVAPKWNGGQLYRGIALSDEEIATLKSAMENSGTIDMMGTSSWTSKRDWAQAFAEKSYDKTPVVLSLEGDVKGVSVKHLSNMPQEDEVTVSKKSKFIMSSIKETIYGRTPVIEITVKEVK